MGKRLWIPLGVLLLALLGAAMWQALRQPAPAYKGRPLTFWLRGFDISYNDPRKPSFDESVEAVRHAGTNALPTLLRMLRARDSDLKHRLTRLAQKQHLVRIDYVSADHQRWAATQAFMALLGREAKYAIPQLVEISREEVAGVYPLPGGRPSEYATEVLELLKQQGEDARRAVETAFEKGGRVAATKASGNSNGTRNAGPTNRSSQ
jgi:hypothetical protein